MKNAAIPVTGFYVLLAAAAVIAIDLRIVLIPAGSASILLTAAGFYTFRHIRCALAIPVPAKEAPAETKHIVVLEAIPVSSQGYDQELIVAVRVRHLVELLACAALSAATLYVMVFSSVLGQRSGTLQIGGFEAELICGAGLAVLLVAVRWFSEPRCRRRSYYTIGTLLARDPGFLRPGMTY